MIEQSKSLLVVQTEQILKPEQRECLKRALNAVAEKLGCELVVADGGLDVSMHRDIRPLLEAQLELQQETNQLLSTLIEALAEEDVMRDDDMPPTHYMDGSPIG